MSVDLFGEEFLSINEYARKVVTKGYSRPFYKIKVSYNKFSKKLYDIKYYQRVKYPRGELDIQVSINEPGLYVLYKKHDNKMECLYSGFTTINMTGRVYRFIKELDDNSRVDETHPAAKKAKRNGIKSTDDLYVVTLPLSEFPETNLDKRFDMKKLDEAVASLLNSSYNERLV